ncbi:MAG: putative bifunctional diguanylate cyclase/phosphodiesterase [Methylophilaceae bacterium]
MKKIRNQDSSKPLGLDREVANLLFKSHNRSLLASIVVAVSLLLVQYKLIDQTNIIIWVIIFVLAYVSRTVLTSKYHKSINSEQDVAKWLQLFRIFSGFCGFAWGMSGVLLFPSDIAHQSFLIFALVGVSGGAVIVYSIDMICSNLFVTALLLPTVYRLISNGSTFTVVIAVLFVVFIIYITLAGRELAKSLRDNITLRVAASHDNERVNKLAYYDVLTNLPNRRLLSDYLNQVFSSCEETKCFGAVLFLDLDDFKNINDIRGHNAGDLLLQQVAQRLQESLRPDDFIARVGGDEFVVVISDLGYKKLKASQTCKLIAEKLINALAQSFKLDSYYYRTSPSIGICVFLGEEFDETEVLRRADIAMYQAKRLGRKSTLQFYDEKLNPDLQERAAIESDLKIALENNQLFLYYQIQSDQYNNSIGAEVLLRWNHPALGFIQPAVFIPIAEESGEIINIGTWLLAQACSQLKLWEHSSLKNKLKLSVNVSALQFNQPDFVDTVIKVIRATKCNPKLLKLELTESIILQNMDTVIKKMNLLQKEGISFSLDDFGTGYSSLSVLKKLPLDELKIDQSFVSDIDTNNDDRFIAQTIIAMGKNLGLNVIAEGVETEMQRKLLSEYGCHAYQGYLFGKPMPLAEFEASLDSFTQSNNY